ncbi:MAG: H-NS histone family protein [Candidatus Competibacteraceae bacterium]|nr:H-NS histone family protein [Candidatus Competibacteraceae bacterium]
MGYALMTTDELLEQKRQIESELIGRINEEIEKIEQRRAELMAMKPTEKPKERAKKKYVKSSRPAKFRNPNDPTQTWTGLGKPPAWVDVVGREACLIRDEG